MFLLCTLGSASASVLGPDRRVLICWFSRSGNTKRVVDQLRAVVKADLFEIKSETSYAGVAGMVRWALHSLTGRVAKTAGPLPDVSAYDAFVVATPVWAFKPAPPVAAFLQAIDFAGKPVVPLATCGSNARDFLGAFERQLGRHGHMIRKRAFSVVGGQSDSALAEALNRWAVNF